MTDNPTPPRILDTVKALGSAFLVDRIALVETAAKEDGRPSYLLCITAEAPEKAPDENHIAFDLIPVAEVMDPVEFHRRFERPGNEGVTRIETGLRRALEGMA